MLSLIRNSLSARLWLVYLIIAVLITSQLVYSIDQQAQTLAATQQMAKILSAESPASTTFARLYEETVTRSEQSRLLLLILGGLALATLSVGGLLIIRSYRQNLGSIARSVSEISQEGLRSHEDAVEAAGTEETIQANQAITNLQTTLYAVQQELFAMAQASQNGNLTRRANETEFSGIWREILATVNTILDEALNPITAQAEVLQKMAEGQLSSKIATDFQGDHAQISDAINKVANITENALAEFDQLITAFAAGNFNQRANLETYEGDWLRIMRGANQILDSVQHSANLVSNQNWINAGLSGLAEQMLGDQAIAPLSQQVINFLADYLQAQIGALYIFDESAQKLVLAGSYAYPSSHNQSAFALGEGLIGQAGLSERPLLLNDLPENYVQVESGIGSAKPKVSLIAPILHEGKLKGVIELASINTFSPISLELLKTASVAIAISLQAAESSSRTRTLLAQTQEQARVLQLQQEELQQSNEELEEQTQQLRSNEEQLRKQQEELRQSNEELEERGQELLVQANQIREKNTELEEAQADIAARANELEAANKYKSEFLANMSHELRTPLNSMLLLARTLSDNRDGNLSAKQTEAAQVIHNSGNDLLNIINDILDLSKIEAGKVDLVIETVRPVELAERAQTLYRHVAEDKGLSFDLKITQGLPTTFNTDPHRLGQVLRNLLSNAFKFTTNGSVTLLLAAYDTNELPSSSRLNTPGILIQVQDTGIGIPLEKQSAIWEAFQQADGSTCREFGGTGLGLTITRELVTLLGGEIHLNSQPGQGSTFSIYLPFVENHPRESSKLALPTTYSAPSTYAQSLKPTPSHVPIAKIENAVIDDRLAVKASQKYILVVEDDPKFAEILGELCHKMNMPFITTSTGEESVAQINRNRPSAVLLDLKLAGSIDGRYVLSHLKTSLDTMHIPVHIISGEERDMGTLIQGAIGFSTKPVTQEHLSEVGHVLTRIIQKSVKDVLVVEDNAELCLAIRHLLEAKDVRIHSVGTAKLAQEELQTGRYDLVILDLGLPDMSGLELLEYLKTSAGLYLPPVIIYTGRDLSLEEHEQLQKYSDSIIIKGACSEERLVADATIFLHRVAADMPESQRKMVYSLHDRNAMFTDKRVLLVDDDIRNIFALSSVLENLGLKISTARNGQEAIDALKQQTATETIDLVLMDIMMPVMDGLEAMRQIRGLPALSKLPIIALTAKAMKEDKSACIQAGANDYLTKPVNVDRLVASLRIWLYR